MSKTKKDSTASLLRARRRITDQLPPFEELLRASLLERQIRCGKPTCHCAEGPGHPAVYVGVTFRGGRTEQITVPLPLLPTIRRWVRNYQRWWNAIEKVSAINRRLLRLRRIPSGPSANTPKTRQGPGRRRASEGAGGEGRS